MTIPLQIVVAMDANRGIGYQGTLPWHLPADLKQFKKITTTTSDPVKTNAVIMGRKTWDSLPEKFRPLPKRLNVVITRQKDLHLPSDVMIQHSLNDNATLQKRRDVEGIFVIGGADIFRQTISLPSCQKLYVTHLLEGFTCDTFFPPFEDQFILHERSESYKENDISYYFALYKRK